MSDVNLLEARGVYKRFRQGSGELEILKNIDLVVTEGESLCLVGASGAGKSTLLHILGALDRPTQGEVLFEGEELFCRNDDELALFRNRTMGFVFQFHHLLNEFTALENVAMPLRIKGLSARMAHGDAEAVLKTLGLGDRLNHFPSQLSGGEQQRVAVARAIINRPRLLFADEPTGNLDSQNGKAIADLFLELWKNLGVTLIVVTHDRELASKFPRILKLHDGHWAH